MDQLFNPKAVVVIGVSENPDNLARNIVENLFEFQFKGEIIPVGKNEGILFGRKVCTSLEDLQEGIDVAMILTPAPTVPGILESCGRKKIPWVIVETGGFSEYSEEGALLEKELLRIARKSPLSRRRSPTSVRAYVYQSRVGTTAASFLAPQSMHKKPIAASASTWPHARQTVAVPGRS